MADTRPLDGSLLHYLPQFQVLICRECQHAIQKSAIDGHLLKHKIYRGDRQRLLAKIARLELLEPDDVPLPTPGSSPVQHLSLVRGHRCAVSACSYLTISEKRMRCHRSEAHGSEMARLCEFSCPVHLQTFFKGARIRYFEVSPNVDETEPASSSGDVMQLNTCRLDFNDGPSSDGDLAIETVIPSPLLGSPQTQSLALSSKASVRLDLETLQLFHHLVATTVLTLPGSREYWQTNMSEALQNNRIMCGLLAISACHVIVLANDHSSTDLHKKQCALLTHEFSMSSHDNAEVEKDEPTNFLGRVTSLLRCAEWAAAEASIEQVNDIGPELDLILEALRGCDYPDWIPSLNDDRQMSDPADQDRERGFSVLVERVQSLPFRMAEHFDRPDNVQDLFAILSAISNLTECCRVSFASDEIEAGWRGASTWLLTLPAHLREMMKRCENASVVVLAHWAVILLDRAEHLGCWFLKGTARNILLHTSRLLSMNAPSARCLVDDLWSYLHD